MNEKHKGISYANSTFVPVFSPSLFFSGIYEGNPNIVFMSLFIIGLGAWYFYKSYEIFKNVPGFIKRLIIASILFTAASIFITVTPEGHNTKIAVIFYFGIPCWLISAYLIFKSGPAKQAYKLWSKDYDKKI